MLFSPFLVCRCGPPADHVLMRSVRSGMCGPFCHGISSFCCSGATQGVPRRTGNVTPMMMWGLRCNSSICFALRGGLLGPVHLPRSTHVLSGRSHTHTQNTSTNTNTNTNTNTSASTSTSASTNTNTNKLKIKVPRKAMLGKYFGGKNRSPLSWEGCQGCKSGH